MDSVAATGFGVNEFGEKAMDAPQDESTVYVLEQTQCAQATPPNQLAALAPSWQTKLAQVDGGAVQDAAR